MEILIKNHIKIKTYPIDIDFFKEVRNNDVLCEKTKHEAIYSLMNNNFIENYNIGQYYCVLKGETIKKNKEEIINNIIGIREQFKWMRIFYENIDLKENDVLTFAYYKHIGFPVYIK